MHILSTDDKSCEQLESIEFKTEWFRYWLTLCQCVTTKNSKLLITKAAAATAGVFVVMHVIMASIQVEMEWNIDSKQTRWIFDLRSSPVRPSRHEFGTKDDNDHNTIGLFTQCLRLVIAVPLSPFGLSRFSIYSRFTFLFGLLVRVFVGLGVPHI